MQFCISVLTTRQRFSHLHLSFQYVATLHHVEISAILLLLFKRIALGCAPFSALQLMFRKWKCQFRLCRDIRLLMYEEINQLLIAHYMASFGGPGLLAQLEGVLEISVLQLAFLGCMWLRRYCLHTTSRLHVCSPMYVAHVCCAMYVVPSKLSQVCRLSTNIKGRLTEINYLVWGIGLWSPCMIIYQNNI